MELVFLPLMILNFAGGIVAGIWLALLGDWPVIGVGLAIGFLGNWIINIALMPGMLLFGTPGMALANRGNNAAALFFAFLNALYVAALISFWCLGTLFLLSGFSRSSSVVPLTLFSYGAATAPWAYLSQKDQQAGGNEFSAIDVLFAEIAFVVVGLYRIIRNPDFSALILVFCMIMAVAVVVGMIIAIAQQRRAHN